MLCWLQRQGSNETLNHNRKVQSESTRKSQVTKQEILSLKSYLQKKMFGSSQGQDSRKRIRRRRGVSWLWTWVTEEENIKSSLGFRLRDCHRRLSYPWLILRLSPVLANCQCWVINTQYGVMSYTLHLSDTTLPVRPSKATEWLDSWLKPSLCRCSAGHVFNFSIITASWVSSYLQQRRSRGASKLLPGTNGTLGLIPSDVGCEWLSNNCTN